MPSITTNVLIQSRVIGLLREGKKMVGRIRTIRVRKVGFVETHRLGFAIDGEMRRG
jgi:hypothetical protein